MLEGDVQVLTPKPRANRTVQPPQSVGARTVRTSMPGTCSADRFSDATPDRTARVVALIPAHDEAATIDAAIRSIRPQVDEVLVVADNCTDQTVAVARSAGAIVHGTVANEHKKAGALNQAFAELLPDLDDADLVLVQDADSSLDEGFIAAAIHHMRTDPTLGAIGGTFRGDYAAPRLLGHLQRNEYARYARDVRRLKGRCLVVTGTAAVFRVGVLREVGAARISGKIPAGDGHGGIYDTSVLTEDNEITFALLHLGWHVLSPRDCTLTTEVMTTWNALWKQRLRWKRGAIENCAQYGWTRITWRYWLRQVLTMLGVLITVVYISSIVWALLGPGLTIAPLWLGITGIFVLERMITLRDRGWRRMILAGLMYELVYDIFLQAIHAKAYLDAAFRRRRDW